MVYDNDSRVQETRPRDTRLHRDVAIKTLPDALLADRERIARFEREAQVPASLDHQHIGQRYGVEEVGAQRYFILDFTRTTTASCTAI